MAKHLGPTPSRGSSKGKQSEDMRDDYVFLLIYEKRCASQSCHSSTIKSYAIKAYIVDLVASNNPNSIRYWLVIFLHGKSSAAQLSCQSPSFFLAKLSVQGP
jgi:hypothetical protein